MALIVAYYPKERLCNYHLAPYLKEMVVIRPAPALLILIGQGCNWSPVFLIKVFNLACFKAFYLLRPSIQPINRLGVCVNLLICQSLFSSISG